MRRSSWLAAGAGGVALAAAALLYNTPANATAPTMTNAVAAGMMRQGAEALERRDADAVLALMTPDAQILGGKPDQLRYALKTTFGQMTGHFSIRIHDVTAHDSGTEARVHLTVDVGEHTRKMDAAYYPDLGVDVKLVKVKRSRLLGLVSGEEWRITEVKTSQHIDLPQPSQ